MEAAEAEAQKKKCAIMCKLSVVKVSSPWHIILFILNCILPGWGTMISACMDKKFNTIAFVFGLIQCLLFVTIIPWVWSIIHGYKIFEKGGK